MKARRENYKQLNLTRRRVIEALLNKGFTPREIADEVKVHISTIYRELKRGAYEHLNSDYTTETRYSADLAEAKYQCNLSAKGAPLKIGKNFAVAQFIEHMILEQHYSPAAVCALLRKPEYLEKFGMTFCRQTIYKYVEDGNIFPGITNKDLPEKGKRKRRYHKVQQKRASRGRSIEERPEFINTREEPGHWEMDTVESGKAGKARLLVLSERCLRHEIVIKIPDGTTRSVVRAINRLERKHGARFPEIFKTITVDNGSEFADCESIEGSCLRKKKRTTLYYCHAYTASERGTNENINRMIRRHLPKGTNLDNVSPAKIQEIEDWINSYPRKILGWDCSADLFNQVFGIA